MKTTCSRPYPLGATLDPNGCNFAVYAPANKDLLLALFHADGSYETHPLESEYAGIQHTYVEGIKAGQKYGFIVQHGDDLLCLSDPYAKALDKNLTYEVPFKPASSFDLAKCVVIDTQFDWQDTPKPERPREEMVLFETHVKGVTKQNPEVEKGLQGTYLGLISEPMLTFYREQNINTLQLLPIAACMHEPHLLEMGKVNYW
ncbi:glycogen debranching enzyme, partial [Vibrio fluvialis]|nr:glycogen debranching enzyme [Vibrio fluvialis]